MTDKFATRVLGIHSGWKGDARLYRLSEPLANNPDALEFYGSQTPEAYEYIVVSKALNSETETPEVLIFGTDDIGYPDSMFELGGVFGEATHEQVLEGAGYKVA